MYFMFYTVSTIHVEHVDLMIKLYAWTLEVDYDKFKRLIDNIRLNSSFGPLSIKKLRFWPLN